MTPQEQYAALDKMEFAHAHVQEMRLREMARQVVDADPRSLNFIGRVTYFPVKGKQVYYDGCEGMNPGSTSYHTIKVDLIDELRDPNVRDAALLIAEQIIRPQLREAGWAV